LIERVVAVRVALADRPVELVDVVLDLALLRHLTALGLSLGLRIGRVRCALAALDLVAPLAVAVNGVNVALRHLPSKLWMVTQPGDTQTSPDLSP
jgi:Fe2+ transport system protein FeoA